MKKYYVLRFWCKKQNMVNFGFVLVQTRTVPAHNVFFVLDLTNIHKIMWRIRI